MSFVDLEYMKHYILDKYGYSSKWYAKVNKMDEKQIKAIYFRLLEKERKEKNHGKN